MQEPPKVVRRTGARHNDVRDIGKSNEDDDDEMEEDNEMEEDKEEMPPLQQYGDVDDSDSDDEDEEDEPLIIAVKQSAKKKDCAAEVDDDSGDEGSDDDEDSDDDTDDKSDKNGKAKQVDKQGPVKQSATGTNKGSAKSAKTVTTGTSTIESGKSGGTGKGVLTFDVTNEMFRQSFINYQRDSGELYSYKNMNKALKGYVKEKLWANCKFVWTDKQWTKIKKKLQDMYGFKDHYITTDPKFRKKWNKICRNCRKAFNTTRSEKTVEMKKAFMGKRGG